MWPAFSDPKGAGRVAIVTSVIIKLIEEDASAVEETGC
jgi:hypothetical protein